MFASFSSNHDDSLHLTLRFICRYPYFLFIYLFLFKASGNKTLNTKQTQENLLTDSIHLQQVSQHKYLFWNLAISSPFSSPLNPSIAREENIRNAPEMPDYIDFASLLFGTRWVTLFWRCLLRVEMLIT